MHKMKFQNKTILITGAAHGLGRELALLLDEMGCLLYLIDRDAQGLFHLAQDLTQEHQLIQCDLSDLRERIKLIQRIKKAETKINILINCAGIGSHSQLSQLNVEEIERVIQVNTLAPLELIASLSPLELIVNIGSVAGEMSLPSISLYSASKSSLHAFTKSIQLEGMNTLLVILGPLGGTDFVQSIEHPRTGQPKWYRELDLDVKLAARGIMDAMKGGKRQIVLPRWYQIVFIVVRLFLPLMKIFGRQLQEESSAPGNTSHQSPG